ncbi:MAG: hypothetical protein IJI88_07715 [Atopobiaceae bacterium]|nr:hypothetical protein [Olsenella sp.]MBQ6492147.1 hypothetical protein [Atopobiaceae bacterium]
MSEQIQPKAVESASATTNAATNTSGNAIYVIFAVATVALCLLLSQVGSRVGPIFGEVLSELYVEYGDELDLEEFQEFQGQVGDDPVSPDFSDLLDGEDGNA